MAAVRAGDRDEHDRGIAPTEPAAKPIDSRAVPPQVTRTGHDGFGDGRASGDEKCRYCRYFCRYARFPHKHNDSKFNEYFVKCGWSRPSHTMRSHLFASDRLRS
jgi:hypothetical protein